jgi:hypothetical protein
MRAFAVLGVESSALWVLIASVGTVIEAVNVMILSIVSKMAIRPHFNPTA